MHLAIVSPFPPAITGIGQYGYYVTRALAQSGSFSRITVLAGSGSSGETPNHLGSTDIDYCWQPGTMTARRAILSRLKSLHPDLVWFNLGASIFGRSPWTNVSGSLTPMFARRSGFPTVVTLHELVEFADLRALNAPGGPLAKLGARMLTTIATHADVICLTMRQYKSLLSPRPLECTYIPIGAYHEPELLEESNSKELLFFTTLAPFKGLELLLESFTRLQKAYPDLRLKIAGAAHARFPHYGRELKDRFERMPGIVWLGQVPEDRVMNLFRDSQIVVVPYLASTGSSSVLYQAATWGRSIVASDLKEFRTLAEEGNLQIEFFKAGQIDSLSSAIQALLNSAQKRRQQTWHNFSSVLQTCPEVTGRKYIQAFNRAFERRNSPKRIRYPVLDPEAI
ncbi:MAG: glycosyltransferase family 4 protein [Chloroflexota bacterium]|nr:glycosyltransferase family 4 protein [Chloroflexota bacterium]